MSFKNGFEKTAIVAPIARMAGRALLAGGKLIGRGFVRAMGGKLNAAATTLGVASDAKGYAEKLRAAREGLM